MGEQQDRLAEIRQRVYGLVEAATATPVPPPSDRTQRALLERLLMDADWLIGKVDHLRIEVGRLRGRLREIEWASSYIIDLPACPACGETEDTGHGPKCWLADEIHSS